MTLSIICFIASFVLVFTAFCMEAYRGKLLKRKEEFKKKEAERIALEEHARAAVRDNDIEKLSVIASEHNDVSQAAPKTVKTSEANMHMRKNIRFEIVDMDLIPKAYLLVNDSAVKAAIKEGYDVPGIKHWIEMTPTIVG